MTLSFITCLVGSDTRQEQRQETVPRNNACKMKGTHVKWEKREKRKKIKREGVCEGFFFSAAVHGFLISSEITERDELSRVTNPSTRASPTHPHALMALREFPLLLFNGDGYPNK